MAVVPVTLKSEARGYQQPPFSSWPLVKGKWHEHSRQVEVCGLWLDCCAPNRYFLCFFSYFGTAFILLLLYNVYTYIC